jgi:hypothetical protein
VSDAFGNDKPLPFTQLDGPSLQIDEQFSFEDEKEFFEVVVLGLMMLSALPEEMKYDHNQRDDQKDVNQPADDFLEKQKAEQPDDDQNYSYA